MKAKPKQVRKSITIGDDRWTRIIDLQFELRIKNQADAVRQIVDAGIDALRSKKLDGDSIRLRADIDD